MKLDGPLPLLGFAAFSGTGKTTLLEQLIPLLREQGLRIALVKHTHHDFDIDRPGKDSYRLREAGAEQVLLASSRRWALLVETPGRDEADLGELLGHLDTRRADLILVEGFRHAAIPKIELHRDATGRPWLHPDDPNIIAVVSDRPPPAALPWFSFDDLPAIRDFVMARVARHPENDRP